MIPVGEDGLELLDLHGLEVWDLVVLGGTLGDREEREERDEREHEPPVHDA